jgi:hypothetical protein
MKWLSMTAVLMGLASSAVALHAVEATNAREFDELWLAQADERVAGAPACCWQPSAPGVIFGAVALLGTLGEMHMSRRHRVEGAR